MQVVLTINERYKDIPYKSQTHEDGSQNFGFTVLKGKPEKASQIQEAKDNGHLRNIVEKLNVIDTPFFSVGCEKSFNKSEGEYWAKGYIEFSYNYEKLLKEATYYFQLFFHFNNYIKDYVARADVQYWWELQPGNFKAVNCSGFTCCVWITTGESNNMDTVKEILGASVDKLAEYLQTVRPIDLPRVYGQQKRGRGRLT